MDVFETIHSARAIRHFRSDPVPREIITRILDAAIQAPSAGNGQHWLFVVVTDAGQRRKIGDIYRRASAWVEQKYASRSASGSYNPGAVPENDDQRRLSMGTHG